MELIYDVIDYLQSYELWGNTLYSHTKALLVFLAIVVGLKVFQLIILKKLRTLAEKSVTKIDDVAIEIFQNIKPPFYILIALFTALRYLNVSEFANQIFFIILIIFVVLEVVRALDRLLDFVVTEYLDKEDEEGNIDGDKLQTKSMIRIMKTLLTIVLWVIAILMILSNMGINVTSLVASLGIGGIAIALALQNILGDMFSSFSLYLDKPFVVGDMIQVGTDRGTVEKIGLKTTRIRSVFGEQLVISNKELTTARVQNFRKVKKRRESFVTKVVYGASKEKLEMVPGLIKEAIESVELTEVDRVNLSNLGDSSIDFETVYLVDTSDFKTFTEIREKIYLKLIELFEKNKIEFAYPTQVIYQKK